MTTRTLLTSLCLCFTAMVYAQTPEINTKLVMAQDDMRLKNFRQATHSLNWLLTNAPEHSKSIYIMAYKAYEKAAEASKKTSEKAMLLDSMMLTYRLKEQRFGLSDLEQNNLAFRYYKYYRKDVSRYEEALTTYQTVFSKPRSVINNNIPGYMSVIRAYNTRVKQMDADQLMAVHANIRKVVELKRQSGMDVAKLKKYTDVVDQVFYQTIQPTLNCDVIEKIATGADLSELDFAKMIFAWSLDFGCSDQEYFSQAAVTIAQDPESQNPGIMTLLAKKAAARGDYAKAIEWYEKSLPLWTEDAKKANTYMDMAKVYQLTKEKAKARTAAFKAGEIDEQQLSGAQSFVANLYMGGFEECSEKYSQIDDRAIFMAAYDLFQKAGDNAGMQAARAQFPTVTQAFTETYKDGDAIDVGCWIKVKTTLKTRPTQ